MANRTLVACYSRSGTTSHVARRIATALGADLDLIEEHETRKGFGGWVCAIIEAIAKGLPTIRPGKDPRDYDLVVIGTPVWAGTMASPVRSYLYLNREALDNVAFFAVMASQGGDDVAREMRLACDAPGARALVLTQRDVENESYGSRLDAFIEALRTAPETTGAKDPAHSSKPQRSSPSRRAIIGDREC
jgi:flavodoxin